MPPLSIGLLARSQCQITPFALAKEQTTRNVRALQPAPFVHFAVNQHDSAPPRHTNDITRDVGPAHAGGVNALVVDRFEGRYVVSGGADGSISMWDLQAGEERATSQGETANGGTPATVLQIPLGTCKRSPSTHTYGITSLQFYPFDSLAFLSSSYDHTLKVWSSTTLTPSASFDLASVIYSAAISPIATHLLVACATQHPAVRLVDLRSAAATQSLAGHTGGSVLSVAWSPKDEHVIASGGTDGTVRLWDVRRSAGCLGTLNLEDSVGVVGYDFLGLGSRPRETGKAHIGPVNGVVWTDDARHVATTGHDEKIRVWDMHSGANTLVNFGPKVRNRNLFSTLLPLIVPKRLLPTGQEILLFPNEKEILMFEMFEGRLLKRLKNTIVTRGRITALAWRPFSIEMLSAHADGTVRSWQPHTSEDAAVEEDEQSESGLQKRKRDVLDDIERDLAGRNITFT